MESGQIDAALKAVIFRFEKVFPGRLQNLPGRLQGRIDLAGFHNSGEAERLDAASEKFGAALTTASRMESKALELRAANDLAEVLVLQDNGAEAARLLDGILRRFDETDGAEDFTRARATLKKLK